MTRQPETKAPQKGTASERAKRRPNVRRLSEGSSQHIKRTDRFAERKRVGA